MESILFAFRPDVSPARQSVILAQIRSWEGIWGTGPLQPDSTDAELNRIYYAYLEEDADAQAILDRLLALPEIESAELPTGRYLS